MDKSRKPTKLWSNSSFNSSLSNRDFNSSKSAPINRLWQTKPANNPPEPQLTTLGSPPSKSLHHLGNSLTAFAQSPSLLQPTSTPPSLVAHQPPPKQSLTPWPKLLQSPAPSSNFTSFTSERKSLLSSWPRLSSPLASILQPSYKVGKETSSLNPPFLMPTTRSGPSELAQEDTLPGKNSSASPLRYNLWGASNQTSNSTNNAGVEVHRVAATTTTPGEEVPTISAEGGYNNYNRGGFNHHHHFNNNYNGPNNSNGGPDHQ